MVDRNSDHLQPGEKCNVLNSSPGVEINKLFDLRPSKAHSWFIEHMTAIICLKVRPRRLECVVNALT